MYEETSFFRNREQMGHDLVGTALHAMDGEQVTIEFLVFSVIPRLQPSIGVSACTRDNPH